MLKAYKPSGRRSPRGYFFLPLLFILAIAGGTAYEWLLVNLPAMWIFYLLIPIFLAGVGICVDRALTYSHWRSVGGGVLVGLIAAGIFLIAGFVAIYQFDAGGTRMGRGFFEFLSSRLETGVPLARSGNSTRSIAISGWLLVLLWLIEAGAFLIVGLGAGFAATERVYCESCSSWANRAIWKFRLRNVPDASVQTVKDAAEFGGFLSAVSLSTDTNTSLEYAVHGCSCGKAASLKILQITQKGKNKEENKSDLREDIALTPKTLTQLLDWAESKDYSLAERRPKLALAAQSEMQRNRRPLTEDVETMALAYPEGEHKSFYRWGKWLGASDSYVDNEFTKAVRARVQAGDYLAAEEAIRAQRHPDDLAYVAEAMADWDEAPDWFDEWIEARPDSFVPRMVRGIFHVKWAWHARGMSWKPKNVGAFFERLEIADRELEHAAAMESRDPVSRSWLVYTAMGLQLPKEQAIERFQQAVQRYPAHRSAYSFLATCMAEKWGGSDEKMLQIVRQGSAAASPGKSVHAVVAEAHLLAAGTLAMKNGMSAVDEYLRRPAVRSEIRSANEKMFRAGSFKPTMDTPRARQYFAYVLWRAGETDAAAEHLRVIGKSSAWSVFSRPFMFWQGSDSIARARKECGVK